MSRDSTADSRFAEKLDRQTLQELVTEAVDQAYTELPKKSGTQSTLGDTALGNTVFGDTALGDTALGDTVLGDTTLRGKPLSSMLGQGSILRAESAPTDLNGHVKVLVLVPLPKEAVDDLDGDRLLSGQWGNGSASANSQRATLYSGADLQAGKLDEKIPEGGGVGGPGTRQRCMCPGRPPELCFAWLDWDH